MSIITETTEFSTEIFQIDTNTPLRGGEPAFGQDGQPTDGHLNAAIQQLANRTQWLKDNMGSTETGLPIIPIAPSDASEVIPYTAFEQDGVYIVQSFSNAPETVVTVQFLFDPMGGSTKDFHIFAGNPVAVVAVQPDPEAPGEFFSFPVAYLTSSGTFSARTLAATRLAGVPIEDGLNNEVVNLPNSVFSGPNSMYVSVNPYAALTSQTLQIPADYGLPGFEYHVMSDMDEPVYLEYADGSPITTASGFTNKLRTRYSVATIKKINDTTWVAFGDLAQAVDVA